MNKPILTLRQRIILSHVWSLAEEEKLLLDKYSKCYITAGLLSKIINTDHEYKDRIGNTVRSWEIHYVNTCYSDIQEMNKDSKLLLSMRANRASEFYAVLILKNPKPNQITDETPQYLTGEGVQ